MVYLLNRSPLPIFLEAVQEVSVEKLETSLAQSVTLTTRSFREGVAPETEHLNGRESVLSFLYEKLLELQGYEIRVVEGTASRAALEWGAKEFRDFERPLNYTLLVEFEGPVVTRLTLSHDT